MLISYTVCYKLIVMIEYKGEKYDRLNYFIFNGELISHYWNEEPHTVLFTNNNLQLFFSNGSYSICL